MTKSLSLLKLSPRKHRISAFWDWSKIAGCEHRFDSFNEKCSIFFSIYTTFISKLDHQDKRYTLWDKISADKSAENLACYRKFFPPKILSAEILSEMVFNKYTYKYT